MGQARRALCIYVSRALRLKTTFRLYCAVKLCLQLRLSYCVYPPTPNHFAGCHQRCSLYGIAGAFILGL